VLPHKCYIYTRTGLKKHFYIFYFLLCKMNDYISCSVLLFLSVLLTVVFPALLKFDKSEVIFIYAFQNVTSARYEINFWLRWNIFHCVPWCLDRALKVSLHQDLPNTNIFILKNCLCFIIYIY